MTILENDPLHRRHGGGGGPGIRNGSAGEGFSAGWAAPRRPDGLGNGRRVLGGLARPANAAPLQAEGAGGGVLAAARPPTPAPPGAWPSYNYRMSCATYWKNQPVAQHLNNGDEARYPSRIGNYSKALPHNSFGEVDPAAYQSLLNAVGERQAGRLRRHRHRRPDEADQPAGRPGVRPPGRRLLRPRRAAAAGDRLGRDGERGGRELLDGRCCATSTSSTTPTHPGRGRGLRRPQPLRRRLQGRRRSAAR